MKITEWCEQILCGQNWDDKLAPIDSFDDSIPKSNIKLPKNPGRPPGLGLDEWQNRERTHFRDVNKFHSEKERGLVLHFFANHELLGLELMALAILKFPDAPSAFRRGVVQTLKDEQNHVRLYKSRMAEVGVEFGQIPVSDYFWRVLSPMSCPQDYVTGLSMTLEQANLDYAIHFAGIYNQLGDHKTASILRKVYKDEIGHVKHGLIWFNRWRDSNKSQWEGYENTLPKLLSPARAKGIGFNRDGRLKAGLDPNFIDTLQLYSRSRGRTADIFWFNGNCEGQIISKNIDEKPSKLVNKLEHDLRTLPALLCKQDDIVLVEKKPSLPFLKKLNSIGFIIPEFVEYKNTLETNEFRQRKIGHLQPWGWSPKSAQFLKPLTQQSNEEGISTWSDDWSLLYSKSWSAKQLGIFLARSNRSWLCDRSVIGTSCNNIEEVKMALEKRGNECVVKADIASSGRGNIHVRDGVLRTEQLNRLKKILSIQGKVVVESWLTKVLDLSFHFDLHPNGSTTKIGWTRFITDKRGQYRGSIIGNMTAGLCSEIKQFLYGKGRAPHRFQELGEELMESTGSTMSSLGYVGPIGIDTIIYRDPKKKLRIKPIIEINPRWTMGRVGKNLSTKVNSSRTGIWLIVQQREANVIGNRSLHEWAEYIEKSFPIEFTTDGQISRGAVFTTDPVQSNTFATLLLVDETLEKCRQRALSFGIEFEI